MQLWGLPLSVTALTTSWTGKAYADGFEVNYIRQNKPELIVRMLTRRAPGEMGANYEAGEEKNFILSRQDTHKTSLYHEQKDPSFHLYAKSYSKSGLLQL
jgi:hypothetical protein